MQGPLAFYKGFIPNFGRLGSWNVIMFLTLEQVLKPSYYIFFPLNSVSEAAHSSLTFLAFILMAFLHACLPSDRSRNSLQKKCQYNERTLLLILRVKLNKASECNFTSHWSLGNKKRMISLKSNYKCKLPF